MIWKKKPSKEIEFPQFISINDIEYAIKVVFSKKKSSSVSINKGELIFRLSSYLSEKKAQEHFKELLQKISIKIEKQPNRFKEHTIKEVLEKEYFYFAGESYRIEYTKNRGIKLKENTFFINYKILPENIEKNILKLLCERYENRVSMYVKELNLQTYNYKIKEITIKCIKSKWGHCTHDNKIMLNLKLLNADKEILDYVIFHEISHIVHKNHSIKFWKEVERFCPNYKGLRKTLKEKPPQIFEF